MFKKNLILSLVMLAGTAQASLNIENHDLSYTVALDTNGQPDHSKSAYYVEFSHPTGNFNINLPPKGNTVNHAGPTAGYTSIKIKQSNGNPYLNCKATPSTVGPNLTVNVHKNLCVYVNH